VIRRLLAALVLAGIQLFPTPVSAQVDVADDSAEPPPAPERKKALLFSAGIGAGVFSATSGATDDQRHFSGKSLSLAFLAGGHAGARASFGAAYLRDQVLGLRARDDLADGDEPIVDELTFYLNTVALFGDITLVERPELHLQLFAGRGWLGVLGRPGKLDDEVDEPSGFAFAAALSAEYRLVDRVAVGGALRVVGAPFSVDEGSGGGTSVGIVVPALLLTARYD
jgi:hypothetical protein